MEEQDKAGASASSHLIITVHGIRTYGQWQERLERLVKDTPSPPGDPVEFINYKFGYFSAVKFLVPTFRWFVVRRFRNDLIIKCTQARWDRIDFVGHSFGTHVIGHAIRRLPEGIRINTVILAGSVLKADFPWRDLIGKKVTRVVNDCGLNDKVLLLSNLFSLFTGMAGRAGFSGATSAVFRNRYSLIGHSGYFQDENGKSDDSYMSSHWAPLLKSDGEIPTFDQRTPRWSDGIVSVIETNGSAFKIVIYLIILAIPLVVYYNLYQRSENNFTIATQTVEGVIKNIGEGLKGVVGMRADTLRKIFDKVEETTDELLKTAPDDPRVLRVRAMMFIHFADTYLQNGDFSDAKAAAEQSVEINRKLLARRPYDEQAKRDVSVSLRWLGAAELEDNPKEALAAFDESLDMSRKFAARRPDDEQAQRDLSISLNRLGDAKLRGNDPSGALKAYQESVKIAQQLADQDKSSAEYQRDLSMSLSRVGDAKLRGNDRSGALEAYQESVDIARQLADQDESRWEKQRDLALGLLRLGETKLLGGDRGEALAGLTASLKSLEILVKLAVQDPSSRQALNDLAVALSSKSLLPKTVQTRTELTKVLSKLDSETQLLLAENLIRRGDEAWQQRGDQAAALAAYQESFVIFLKLRAQHPDSEKALRGVVFSLGKMADPAQKQAALNEGFTILKMLNLTEEQIERAKSELRMFLLKLP